jgi:hypothetical protein
MTAVLLIVLSGCASMLLGYYVPFIAGYLGIAWLTCCFIGLCGVFLRPPRKTAYPENLRIYEVKAADTPQERLAWVGNDLVKGYIIGQKENKNEHQ